MFIKVPFWVDVVSSNMPRMVVEKSLNLIFLNI